MEEQNNIEELKIRLGGLRENVDALSKTREVHPQTSITKGFLPPLLISPRREINEQAQGDRDMNIVNRMGEYEFVDWMGQRIKFDGTTPLTTRVRFDESKDLPKSTNELRTSPYSLRDHYILHNDLTTDYFKHGLQILDGLGKLTDEPHPTFRFDTFDQTPYEHTDPVVFGFEIIFDANSSPLLNDSVRDFLQSYSSVSEIRSKIPVYEEFKNQFKKIFKTNASMSSNDTDSFNFTDFKINYANADGASSVFKKGKNAHLAYYLKKISGLSNLIESNQAETKKYLVDYRKDVIGLEFHEDVSLSIGTLAHLYKMLYWSKPNGKSLVPQNLLRFNCDIIVSECRNFNRVRKAVEDGDLEIIKDNVNRYIYSLKECQFYFNSVGHNGDLDLSNITTFENFTLQFDYKYTTMKMERFVPNGKFGRYIGYDNGAIWKAGNSRTSNEDGSINVSIPSFYTVSTNKLNENGVDSEAILKEYGLRYPTSFEMTPLDAMRYNDMINNTSNGDKNEQKANLEERLGNVYSEEMQAEREKTFIERLRDRTYSNAKREISNILATRTQMFTRGVNKLLIGFVGRKGISPPHNVYFGDQTIEQRGLNNFRDRFFYDVRDELSNFAGGSLSNLLNSATFRLR